jgi:glycine/D-amino acid oxidase-like deaminating enzyme
VVRRKVDFILVGQGIAGSWLSYELFKRGHEIFVFNHETENTSSNKAAGLYNPITGKKMVKTWLADSLFHDLESKYSNLENVLDQKFLNKIPIYRPFNSVAEKNDWDVKIGDPSYSNYIEKIEPDSLGIEYIKDDFGGIIIKNSGYVNLKLLISSFREYLISKGLYKSEMFDYKELEFLGNKIGYKNIEASKVIFCEGPFLDNPYWKNIPFKPVRGELMDIECGLTTKQIINRGVFMIPKGDHYTVGSTYDHSNLTFEPQSDGILNLKLRLSKLFSGPYRIRNKTAGIRPATFDRKPFIGLHPEMETLGIFNGFGTKGVSLTPYFASQFVDFLEGRTKIEKEADVQRVY